MPSWLSMMSVRANNRPSQTERRKRREKNVRRRRRERRRRERKTEKKVETEKRKRRERAGKKVVHRHQGVIGVAQAGKVAFKVSVVY